MNRVEWAKPLGIACRDWLLSLARVEADGGCPRLLGMKSKIATYFADLTDHWGPERRYQLLCERIKWLYTGNYGYPPIPVTEEETAALASWDYPFSHSVGWFRSPGKPGVEYVWPTARPNSVVDADKIRAVHRDVQEQLGAFRIDKKVLKSAVKEAMRPRFGKPANSGPEWDYVTELPGLRVTTTLDFGGRRPSQLRYSQKITRTMGEGPVFLLDYGGISALLERRSC